MSVEGANVTASSGNTYPGRTINTDKDVRQGNNSFARSSRHLPFQIVVAFDLLNMAALQQMNISITPPRSHPFRASLLPAWP